MKISLINMPFAPLESPSIGLTQIAAALKMRFKGQVETQIHYLNLDFGARINDTGFYAQAIAPYARISGLPDWVFRSAAFPESTDNIDEYLARYYCNGDSQIALVADFVRNQRQELYDFLDELIVRYDLASSDIAGFSLSFFQTTASIAMARRLKDLNPDITIIFGGPGVKGVPGKTLLDNVPCIDYVFSGAALHSFPELVGRWLSGDPKSLLPIQGVFARGVACVLPPDQVAGENIDINTELPLDYAPFLDKFASCVSDPALLPYLLMQTSRGCWWADRQRCTFCGLNSLSENFEAMSPEHALKHIRSVLAYSDRVSYFVACDNMAPPNYFQEVFPQLEAQEGVHMKYETRPDLTAVEIQTLCHAGIRCVQPGIEALATESLKLMRKGVSTYSNIRFLKDCAKHALYAEWNLLLFSPGESEAVYRKYERIIPWLAHLQPPVGVFQVEFVRDSCYFEQAQAFGLALEPHESLAYIYPFDQATITGLCFRFSNSKADTAKINLWLERLGTLVAHWRQQWSGAHESRPRLILWRDAHSAVIHDSRSGTEVNYRISNVAETLLQAMSHNPLSLAEAVRLSGLEERIAAEEMRALKEGHLLFEESGRYLSLAVSRTSSKSD